jgi:hypothetical protein
MRIAKEITTKPANTGGQGEVAPTSEIILNGAPTGKLVPGAVLEASVQWEDKYLLFMTDDVPFEEMLSIHLIDGRLNILDSAFIGTPYSPGLFSSLELIESNSVKFLFAAEAAWSIELLAHSRFSLPFINDPPGVKRRPRFLRHFILRAGPRGRKSCR